MSRDAEFEAEREYSQYLQEEKEKEDDMASDFEAGKCGLLLAEFSSARRCGKAGEICYYCKRILELEKDLEAELEERIAWNDEADKLKAELAALREENESLKSNRLALLEQIQELEADAAMHEGE